MQIDDKKRNSFIDMMRDVAESHGCHVEFKWSHIDPDHMRVSIASNNDPFVHQSVIFWPETKSQTKIATSIWSDFFKKYYSCSQIHEYIRHDIEITKSALNAIYGRDSVDNMGRISIKKVIFNGPATIVMWKDGNKTVVQCRGDDVYDPEKGLAMAISKKVFGNNYSYYKTFKKWLPKEKKETGGISLEEAVKRVGEAAAKADFAFDNMNVTRKKESE